MTKWKRSAKFNAPHLSYKVMYITYYMRGRIKRKSMIGQQLSVRKMLGGGEKCDYTFNHCIAHRFARAYNFIGPSKFSRIRFSRTVESHEQKKKNDMYGKIDSPL